MCGKNTSAQFGYQCTGQQVLNALASTPAYVKQEIKASGYYNGIDPSTCVGMY